MSVSFKPPIAGSTRRRIFKDPKGIRLENVIRVALFAGLRQSEILGLTWDRVDIKTGMITVDRQLTRPRYRQNSIFLSPKSGRPQTITAAKTVMAALKAQKRIQAAAQLKASPMWENPHGLAFTNEAGGPLNRYIVDMDFSRITSATDLEGIHFYDTLHTYFPFTVPERSL